MDPNANLAEQRRLAAAILDGSGDDPRDVLRLAELVEALDGWLTMGGALPATWRG